MDDRRDRHNLLGYTYMAVLVIFYLTGINTTPCTDQTGLDNFFHVKSMCTSGTLRHVRVVIDTWDTGGPDVHSCACTVTLDTGSAPSTATTTVVVHEYPDVAPLQLCGSKLRITSTISRSLTKTGCTPIPATPANNFGRSDALKLTLSRTDVRTQWQSGHCILISTDDLSFDVTVACQSAQGATIPTTTTTRETITATQPREPTTTTQQRETTTTSQTRETSTTTQPRETTTYNITNSGSTPLGQEKCVQQQGYPLSAVVVPLVVNALLITFFTAVNVILYRRRLALVKQPKYTEAAMTSQQTVNYESLDVSRLEPPNMYADTSTGQMYVNTAMES